MFKYLLPIKIIPTFTCVLYNIELHLEPSIPTYLSHIMLKFYLTCVNKSHLKFLYQNFVRKTKFFIGSILFVYYTVLYVCADYRAIQYERRKSSEHVCGAFFKFWNSFVNSSIWAIIDFYYKCNLIIASIAFRYGTWTLSAATKTISMVLLLQEYARKRAATGYSFYDLHL